MDVHRRGALVAGSIWLYGGSSRLDPAWWVLALVIAGTVVFMLSGMTAMVRSRFSTPTIGREDLVGEMGLAEADVDPDGVVRIRDALWRARTNRATPIVAGDAVRVVYVEGVVARARGGRGQDLRAPPYLPIDGPVMPCTDKDRLTGPLDQPVCLDCGPGIRSGRHRCCGVWSRAWRSASFMKPGI